MLVVLTFVTGLLDAVTYLGLGHVFAANQTGNVIVLGFALVGAGQISASSALASFVAFVIGAAFSGWTVPRLQRVTRGWARAMFVLEAVLLGLAAVMSVLWTTPVAAVVLVIVIAFCMGMRNVTLQHLGHGTVSTTVVTSTLANLAGIGLVGRRWHEVRPRLGAVLAMIIGAALGAVLLQYGSLLVLGLAAVLTLAISLEPSVRGATFDPKDS
ncbi:MAG: DUF1275 domain-containing protein [Chloroflexi bacterium]|nr:DUF1275 domain-containing protein [Chloroflexota bacterium]